MPKPSRVPLVNLIIASAGGVPLAAALPAEAPFAYEPWADSAGRQLGHGFGDHWRYHVCLYELGSFVFSHDSPSVTGMPQPGVPMEAFEDAFRRWVLPAFLEWHGWEVLHAGGLVVGDSLVALCGDSEAGKSTLAHAWRQRGGRVFADDAVPFRMVDGAPWIKAIPFRIRLRPPSLRYFGVSAAGASAFVYASQNQSEDVGVLRSICILERRQEERGDVLLQPIAPEFALPALLRRACSLTLSDRGRNRVMMESYIALVNAVSVFRLSYPTDLDCVETVLDRLAEHGSSQVAGSLTASLAP